MTKEQARQTMPAHLRGLKMLCKMCGTSFNWETVTIKDVSIYGVKISYTLCPMCGSPEICPEADAPQIAM